MQILLAVGNVAGILGIVVLAVAVWKLSRDLVSARGDLVVEKAANALALSANTSLKEALDRERAVARIKPLPELSDASSTGEAMDSIRESIRALAGLPSAAPAAKNRDDLSDGTVHGTVAGEDSNPGGGHDTSRTE